MYLPESLAVLFLFFAAVRCQTCLCIQGSAVNVRETACGTVIGQANSGQCLTKLTGETTCTLSGTVYNFIELQYNGGSGWIADDYLVSGACPQPGEPGVCSAIQQVSRAEWGARPPAGALSPIPNPPVTTVFVHHTETDECYNQADCSAIVRSIQDWHINGNGWTDIGYSWLVGSDGRAYEGRGFDNVGAHTCCYDCNSKGVGVALIGSFDATGGVPPSDTIMNALKNIIDCGMGDRDIVVWDSLIMKGHRDACSTSCPGSYVYSDIQTWPWYAGAMVCRC